MISSMDEITLLKTKQNWMFYVPAEAVVSKLVTSCNT